MRKLMDEQRIKIRNAEPSLVEYAAQRMEHLAMSLLESVRVTRADPSEPPFQTLTDEDLQTILMLAEAMQFAADIVEAAETLDREHQARTS